MRDDDRVRVLHMIDAADAVAQFVTVNDELPALLPELRALVVP